MVWQIPPDDHDTYFTLSASSVESDSPQLIPLVTAPPAAKPTKQSSEEPAAQGQMFARAVAKRLQIASGNTPPAIAANGASKRPPNADSESDSGLSYP